MEVQLERLTNEVFALWIIVGILGGLLSYFIGSVIQLKRNVRDAASKVAPPGERGPTLEDITAVLEDALGGEASAPMPPLGPRRF